MTCKYGCGNRVSPGTTRNGNPYDTCCRSCVKSLGATHDHHCTQRNHQQHSNSNIIYNLTNQTQNVTISANKPKVHHNSNHCKYGCGHTVSPGTTTKGNPYDTCCRSCAKSRGAHHDHHCITRNRNNNHSNSNIYNLTNQMQNVTISTNKPKVHHNLNHCIKRNQIQTNNVRFNPAHSNKNSREQRLNANKMTLYHLTNHEAANSILDSGYMRSGADGLAGAGIYFATSVEHCTHKARKGRKEGTVLRCKVKLGNVKRIPKSGQKNTFDSLLKEGYDSVLIPRDNGMEYVVYNKDQIERVGVERKIQNYVKQPPPKYEFETAYAITQKARDDMRNGTLSIDDISDQQFQNALWNNNEDPADILSPVNSNNNNYM